MTSVWRPSWVWCSRRAPSPRWPQWRKPPAISWNRSSFSFRLLDVFFTKPWLGGRMRSARHSPWGLRDPLPCCKYPDDEIKVQLQELAIQRTMNYSAKLLDKLATREHPARVPCLTVRDPWGRLERSRRRRVETIGNFWTQLFHALLCLKQWTRCKKVLTSTQDRPGIGK